jgi:hypothetical protein
MVVVLATFLGFLVSTYLLHPDSRYAIPAPVAGCDHIAALPSDPGRFADRGCADLAATLTNTSFDLDAVNGWSPPGYPGSADAQWSAAVDVWADDAMLHAGAGARFVLSNEQLSSYLNCADHETSPPLYEVPLAVLHTEKIHTVCVITNGHRRAALKVKGDPDVGMPIQVIVLVWDMRLSRENKVRPAQRPPSLPPGR